MRLEILESSDAKLWNELIDQASNGTLFHYWEWLNIVEKHSKSRLILLVGLEGNSTLPFIAMPLFLMKKSGLNMVFSPPPATAIVLGPALITKDYKQHKLELIYLEFQAKLGKLLHELRANYVNIITSPGLIDIRPFSWASYQILPCYTYKIDLRPGLETVVGNFSRTIRHKITNALNKGVQITESTNNSDLEYIYQSLTDRYSEQYINLLLKKAYLQDIVQKFGGSSIQLVMAIHEGKRVGGMILVKYKDTISTWLGLVRSQNSNLDVNACIYQYSIDKAIQEGYQWLDMMGANTPSICDSKAKYNPIVDIHFQIKKADWLGKLAEKAYMWQKHSR